jgi:hypothetical protein
LRTFIRQTALLTHRYLAILRGDRLALAMMAGQCLLVALLLVLLFGDLSQMANPFEQAQRTVMLLFLLQVCSFWFGCNNAAKEIVKERTLTARERDYNLLASSYYASKLLVLSALSGLQATLLYLLVSYGCQPPGGCLGYWLFLLGLSLTGVTLGLAISAASRTEDVAVTTIPLALIPQIILAGVVAPLKGVSEFLARLFVTVYWGNRGISALLPETVARTANVEQLSMTESALVLLLHAGLLAAFTLVLLSLQARHDRRLGKAFARMVPARIRRN